MESNSKILFLGERKLKIGFNACYKNSFSEIVRLLLSFTFYKSNASMSVCTKDHT